MNHPQPGSATPMGRRLLTEKEAAEYIGVSVSFLRKSRCSGTLPGHTVAPRFVKSARMVRYDLEDLNNWIDKNKHDVPRLDGDDWFE